MIQNLNGQKIGNYDLQERLGRGGMAEVYRAWQPGMERFVAIKVMLSHLSEDEQFIERFRREAKAVGSLRHTHIVQVFDFGHDEALGIYYMVMEHITAGNLKAYITREGKIPPQKTLKIGSQLADALAYAHKSGMIHRDLKPANVMFSDEEREQSILTDFGIARILTETGLTQSGMAVGTPAYMSPEAALGQDIDERADIYALGVMLYEMLTGNVPYSADTPLAVIMKHVNAPLPTREDFGESIPEAVEQVILKAMAKEPKDRYDTASDMRDALDEVLLSYTSKAQTKQASITSGTQSQPKPASPTVNNDTPVIHRPLPSAAATQPTIINNNGVPTWIFLSLLGLILVVVVVLLAEEFVPINTLINDNTAIANPQTVVTTMFAEETAVVSSDANTTVAAGNDESVEENSTRTNIDETYDEIVQLIADDASLSAVRPLVDELLADDAITAAYTADMAYVAWYYREYDSAQELVAQVLRSNPTHRNALWVQALIEWEIVDVDVAIETLERAKNSPEVESDLLTENFGNHIDVDLATFYVGSGNRSRYFEAMQLIDPLIFTGIDWVEPYLLKGDIQMLIGDYKPACEDTYVRALRVADEEVDDIEYIEELQEDACQLAESQAENQPNRLSPPNTPLTPPRDDDNRQAPPPPPRNN